MVSGVIVFVLACVVVAAAIGWFAWEYAREMRTGGLTKCRACGDIYHKSWGSICPNCSGAD